MHASEFPFPEYPEYLGYIELPAAREAFAYLVKRISQHSDFTLEPRPHGAIKRDVTCIFRDGVALFAFTPARQWLRMYVRRPAQSHPGLTQEKLAKHFTGFGDRRDPQLSFKIQNKKEAAKAFELLFAGHSYVGSNNSDTGRRNVRLSGDDADTEFVPTDADERKIVERQIRERRGQQQFREALRDRYGERCLVTDCKLFDVIEAAHIQPYRAADHNNPQNGLLLRSDIHVLFDLDLIGIRPDSLTVELHPCIEDDPTYSGLAGRRLGCGTKRPSKVALELRYRQFSG